jgi:hypothetical protein
MAESYETERFNKAFLTDTSNAPGDASRPVTGINRFI